MPEAIDFVDVLIEQWRNSCPAADGDALGIAGRVHRLANYFEKRADKALAPLGVTLWQLDVLATLQAPADGAGLAVSDLLHASLLSPGAMTNRLDRLAQAGWVERIPDAEDRRVIRIRLTEAGRKLTRQALEVRNREAAATMAVLAPEDRQDLNRLLRLLLRSLCSQECPKDSMSK